MTPPVPTRILGVDPGSRLTGWGVVEKRESRLFHLDCGVIAPPGGATLPERCVFIADALESVVRRLEPTCAVVEDVFFAQNWRSALKLGQARGAVMTALGRMRLPVSEFSPAQIKLAVTGYGRAEKLQVQQMVRILLGLPEIPEENAADALAAAICRLQAPPNAPAGL